MSNKLSFKAYNQEVTKVVRTIASGYKPEKIILFGSAASGKIRPNSDIDLLIIKDTKDKYLERVKKIALMLNTGFPTDIFVLTPQELDRAIAENRFFIVDEILPKGKVLYDKTKIHR